MTPGRSSVAASISSSPPVPGRPPGPRTVRSPAGRPPPVSTPPDGRAMQRLSGRRRPDSVPVRCRAALPPRERPPRFPAWPGQGRLHRSGGPGRMPARDRPPCRSTRGPDRLRRVRAPAGPRRFRLVKVPVCPGGFRPRRFLVRCRPPADRVRRRRGRCRPGRFRPLSEAARCPAASRCRPVRCRPVRWRRVRCRRVRCRRARGLPHRCRRPRGGMVLARLSFRVPAMLRRSPGRAPWRRIRTARLPVPARFLPVYGRFPPECDRRRRPLRPVTGSAPTPSRPGRSRPPCTRPGRSRPQAADSRPTRCRPASTRTIRCRPAFTRQARSRAARRTAAAPGSARAVTASRPSLASRPAVDATAVLAVRRPVVPRVSTAAGRRARTPRRTVPMAVARRRARTLPTPRPTVSTRVAGHGPFPVRRPRMLPRTTRRIPGRVPARPTADRHVPPRDRRWRARPGCVAVPRGRPRAHTLCRRTASASPRPARRVAEAPRTRVSRAAVGTRRPMSVDPERLDPACRGPLQELQEPDPGSPVPRCPDLGGSGPVTGGRSGLPRPWCRPWCRAARGSVPRRCPGGPVRWRRAPPESFSVLPRAAAMVSCIPMRTDSPPTGVPWRAARPVR
ncbi:hypothetical protein SAMN06264365_115123 [Actinoplanes regularis]|uniref:Uncharacterized protein n=1 Tax=Actinoplanes regularis TaxID=52697 RepID=A0A239EFJ2_9ACTN|nr:hypothetical protein SAMN06264365_115123 [Actinoplanes regularis]